MMFAVQWCLMTWNRANCYKQSKKIGEYPNFDRNPFSWDIESHYCLMFQSLFWWLTWLILPVLILKQWRCLTVNIGSSTERIPCNGWSTHRSCNGWVASTINEKGLWNGWVCAQYLVMGRVVWVSLAIIRLKMAWLGFGWFMNYDY